METGNGSVRYAEIVGRVPPDFIQPWPKLVCPGLTDGIEVKVFHTYQG